MGLKMEDLQEPVQARGVANKGQCVSSNTLSARTGISAKRRKNAAEGASPGPQLSSGPLLGDLRESLYFTC
jgi:hypothetical protein